MVIQGNHLIFTNLTKHIQDWLKLAKSLFLLQPQQKELRNNCFRIYMMTNLQTLVKKKIEAIKGRLMNEIKEKGFELVFPKKFLLSRL